MSDSIIKVENLGKKYFVGAHSERGYRTLRDAVAGLTSRAAGVVKSFIGRTGGAGRVGEFWALDDVSFDVRQGDVIGVIGRNGAGKSTLLKILSRITYPTKGRVRLTGRVASLLEVGTGFHPELSGRENIYFNGAILGMRRSEIRRKFDDIVAFAEVERFLDTPVKRYSSGMHMRLAFAVAAHLEPEILIVDEVLAVGDAEFQKKCLGKMESVANSGRTIFFVSHNMGAVAQLCTSAILLESGRLKSRGQTRDVIKQYLQRTKEQSSLNNCFEGNLTGRVAFNSITVTQGGLATLSAVPSAPIEVTVKGECRDDIPSFRTTFSLYFEGTRLFTLHDTRQPESLPRGVFQSTFVIPPEFLRPGEYSIAIGGYRDGMTEWIWGTDLTHFSVLEEWSSTYEAINLGLVNLGACGTRTVMPAALTR